MIQGRRELDSVLIVQGVQVSFVEAGKPRFARQRLQDLFANLEGLVRICDPYYGVRTLDSLDMIPRNLVVHFLTVQTSENNARLQGALQDLKREAPKTEIRKLQPPLSLHDRYIIDDTGLRFVGHGLKDIGGKDSFIIALPLDMVRDLTAELTMRFDSKWSAAVAV
jgi:hypothetical protein